MVFKILSIIFCILLICSLTTLLAGKEPPSFMQLLNMASDISIDMEPVYTAFNSTEKFVADPIDDDGFFSSIGNFFIGLWNSIAPILSFFYAIVTFLWEFILSVLHLIKFIFYLMFGIDITTATVTLPA